MGLNCVFQSKLVTLSNSSLEHRLIESYQCKKNNTSVYNRQYDKTRKCDKLPRYYSLEA